MDKFLLTKQVMNEADGGDTGGEAGGGGEAESTEAKTYSQEEFDTEVSGLKENRNKVLGENKALKEKLATIEAEASEAKKEAMRKTGDVEALEANLRSEYEGKLESMSAELDDLRNGRLSEHQQASINELSGQFVSSKTGQRILDGLVKSSYGDDGSIVTTYHDIDGKPLTTNATEYKKYLESESELSAVLRGPGSNGGKAAKPEASSRAAREKNGRITTEEYLQQLHK